MSASNAVCIAIAFAWTLSFSATAQDSKPQTTVLRIVDQQGQPISNATCFVQAGSRKGKREAEKKRLAPGVFELTFTHDTVYASLRVKAPGYTPMLSRWSPDNMKKGIDPEIVFKMKKGVTISGHVHDEQGNGIAQATVRLLAITPDRRGTRPYPSLYDHPVKTNDKGVWRCDLLPEQMSEVWLRFEHRNYISDDTFGQTSNNVSVDQLREGTLVSVMKKGKTVVGTVMNPNGQPIEGATIYQGSDRFGSHFPKTNTDAKGTFRFPNSRAGKMVLTIYAKGYAPELLEIDVAPNSRAARIKLKKGNKLLLKVVDPDGKPLGGVMVACDTWRKHRSLCDLPIPRRTDKNGEFVWEDAPSDAIAMDILRQGYMDIRNREISANGEHQLIEMSPPLRITGKVTDATTGTPIKSFSVVPGIRWDKNHRANWQPAKTKQAVGGSYEIGFTYPYPSHLLRFDAVGYKSKTSRAIKPNEGSVTLDVQLQPTKPLAGIVVSADGKPVHDAKVLINVPGQYVKIRNGRIDDGRDVTFDSSDKNGAFQLPTQGEDAWIIVLHPSGMRLVECKTFDGGKIQLVPWSTIRGAATSAGKPLKQYRVNLDLPTDSAFSIEGNTNTDDQGNYTLQRVPPDATVSVSLVLSNGNLHTESVQTEAGKDTKLDFSP